MNGQKWFEPLTLHTRVGRIVLLLLLLLQGKSRAESAETILPFPSKELNRQTIFAEELQQAQTNEQLGKAYRSTGDIDRAIRHWQLAVEQYTQFNQPEKAAQCKVAIASAYVHQGKSLLATSLLQEVLSVARLHNNAELEGEALEELGNAYLSGGSYSEAISTYEEALESGESLSLLNNTVLALQGRQEQYQAQVEAVQLEKEFAPPEIGGVLNQYAARALNLSEGQSTPSALRALLNWAQVGGELNAEQLQRGRMILESLSPSRTKVYLAMNWAAVDSENARPTLLMAAEVAEKIGDRRAASFAHLELGKYFEQRNSPQTALLYAQQAQKFAQAELAFDSLYRAQWQAARIYRSIGRNQEAIAAYEEAVASLQSVQADLVTAARELRLDFQEEVEPVYRQYLELLLEQPESDLEKALSLFDNLQLAQLQNFFGDDCFELVVNDQTPQEVLAQTNAALITSIILPDKTYIIARYPDGLLKKYAVPVAEQDLNQQIQQWRLLLVQGGTERFLPFSQSFYNLLIRPLEQDLAKANPSTIVFVHDGLLRNVPMAALHSGSQFLVEQYAIANSLGLNIAASRSNPEDYRVSAFGLSEGVGQWSPLLSAREEVEAVEEIIGGDEYLNERFTVKAFENEVEEGSSIVHLATHGYFGGFAERSFIQAWDRTINVLELEEILLSSNRAIELLVLSACETAVGSDRSVLGLAGVAARSRVDSTLGTLWAVSDDAQSQIIQDFYQNLLSMPKAQALQQAQIKQIEQLGTTPREWAGVSLIGNWN